MDCATENLYSYGLRDIYYGKEQFVAMENTNRNNRFIPLQNVRMLYFVNCGAKGVESVPDKKPAMRLNLYHLPVAGMAVLEAGIRWFMGIIYLWLTNNLTNI
jgi:hypothetical protein